MLVLISFLDPASRLVFRDKGMDDVCSLQLSFDVEIEFVLASSKDRRHNREPVAKA